MLPSPLLVKVTVEGDKISNEDSSVTGTQETPGASTVLLGSKLVGRHLPSGPKREMIFASASASIPKFEITPLPDISLEN